MVSDEIKVALPEPAEIDGKEVNEIIMRQPIGADLEDVIGAKSPGVVVTALASRLATNVPLTEEDVRKLSAKNYMALSEVVLDFLG